MATDFLENIVQATEERQLVVFDFDGTLCLGDDPVLTYSRLVDEALADHNASEKSRLEEAVRRGLEAGDLNVPEIRLDEQGYPADIAGRTDMALWPLQDGYQLVQLLGLQAGLDATETHAAFRTSRAQLLDRGLASTDVHAPDRASEVITQLRDQGAAVVLITNSPAVNFDVWLTQLGLLNQFDVVINSAKKPTGMAAAVEQVRKRLGSQNERVPMSQVISVGDIWGNDLAYVHEQGGHTVLIDRFATGLGTPDHRVDNATAAMQLLGNQMVSQW